MRQRYIFQAGGARITIEARDRADAERRLERILCDFKAELDTVDAIETSVEPITSVTIATGRRPGGRSATAPHYHAIPRNKPFAGRYRRGQGGG